jgi:Ion channel
LDRIIKRLKKLWNDRSNFNFLLVVLSVYIFIIIPVFKDKISGEFLFFIFYYLLLSGGAPFLIRNSRLGILFLLLITPFVILFSEFFFRSVWLKICADLFIVVYCISLATIILIRTFAKGHVTVHRVLGAIVVYLLLSFIFAMLFHIIYLLNVETSFKGLVTNQRSEFMYFSLSTLTTVAYGDITPVNALARSLSNMESLSGQLYISVLIAGLVSLGFQNSNTKVNT